MLRTLHPIGMKPPPPTTSTPRNIYLELKEYPAVPGGNPTHRFCWGGISIMTQVLGGSPVVWALPWTFHPVCVWLYSSHFISGCKTRELDEMAPKGPSSSSTDPGSQWNAGSLYREENRLDSASACHQHSTLGLWEGCSLLR